MTATRTTGAVAAGLATITADGTVLDTWFPAPQLVDAPGPAGTERLTADQAVELLGATAPKAIRPDAVRGVEVVAVRTVISSLEDKPLDAHDAYLRLHLLSHRLVKPHGQNLDGVFGLLTNVAWTSLGPVAVDQVETVRLNARAEGLHLQVTSIDKFPRMTDYVAPKGVRIADADRVRLGAHLAEGTTVMHEGFVNFNMRHPRHLHGRGPHLRGRRRRRRLRHRRRRLHHGHPVGRRQADHLDRRALPGRRRGGRRHRPGRRVHRRGRPCT